MMNQRKSWSQQEDQILIKLYKLNASKLKTHVSNWNSLSKLLNQQNIGPVRTGKQCRQRWFNQLDPLIKKDEVWSDQEEEILFKSHQKYGNRWSLISKNLPGRTDNSIKNYFNSFLRKSLRLINLYIASNRKYKQFKFRNVKQYKPQLLSKILALSSPSVSDADGPIQCYKFTTKYKEKETQKQKKAQNLAKQIKKKLLNIVISERFQPKSQADPSHYTSQIQYQDIIIKIHQLNSQCKKRKPKKGESLNYNVEDQISQDKMGQENQRKKISISDRQHPFKALTLNNAINFDNAQLQKKPRFQFQRSQRPLQSFNDKELGKTSAEYQHFYQQDMTKIKIAQPLLPSKERSSFQKFMEIDKGDQNFSYPKNRVIQSKRKDKEKIQFQKETIDYVKNYGRNHQVDEVKYIHQDCSQRQKNKCMLDEDKDFFNCLSNSQHSQEQQEWSYIISGDEIYEQDDWLISSHYI